MNVNILKIVDMAEKAGKAIMKIYSRNDFGTTFKVDNTPLTLADTASHKVIKKHLKTLTPEIPLLSEESRATPYKERKLLERYWLVDPLDGTKEFINRNGEFTVNIALIDEVSPILGVVHAPSPRITYYATREHGAFKKESNGQIKQITVKDYKNNHLKVVASRSHKGERLEGFLKQINSEIGIEEYISMGSSLKFCLVAEGTAHFYPRLGPTMEWDTAAAQCIVEKAGGIVVDLSGNPLQYNKEDLRNSDFMVLCSKGLLKNINSLN